MSLASFFLVVLQSKAKWKMNFTKYIISFIFIGLCITLKGQTEYKVFRYPNDSIASEGTLRDGKPDGYWKTYYETGILKSEGNRKDFLLDGLWVFYSEEGDTTLAVHYQHDLKNGKRNVYLSDEIQEDDLKQVITSVVTFALTRP